MPKQRKTLTKQQDIEERIQQRDETERELFADTLQAARAVYALRPELVTAPEYPAEFWPDFVRSCALNREDPNKAIHAKPTDIFDPAYRQCLLRDAKYAYKQERRKAKVERPSGFQPDGSLTTEGLSRHSNTHTVAQPRTQKVKFIYFSTTSPATW